MIVWYSQFLRWLLKYQSVFKIIGAASSKFVSSSIPSWQILTPMLSHSQGPGIWLSVWRFLLTHCLYERAAEVLARLRGCAGSPEPSLLAKVISTKFAWRGPLYLWRHLNYKSQTSFVGNYFTVYTKSMEVFSLFKLDWIIPNPILL